MNNQRIDLSLLDTFPDLSRTVIKQLIINGLIRVNGENVMPNYKLEKNDKVEFDREKVERHLKQGHSARVKPYHIDIEVIYEDDNLLIINKPENLNSHPVLKRDNKSLLNAIYYHLQKTKDLSRVRLVNRLDKETSGLVLATKNLKAHDYYSKLFEERRVEKEYKAIVHGDFEKYLAMRAQDYIAYTSYLAKDPKEKKSYTNTSPNKGKLAKSKIYFDKHFNKFGKMKFSLVTVIPETGRTHQIRVHLSTLHFPILGDTLYGGQKYKRLMLHSHAITLKLLGDKKDSHFVAELPEKFED